MKRSAAAWLILSWLMVGTTLAQDIEREIPVPDAPGIHLSVSSGAAGDPVQRVAAESRRMAERLGSPLTNGQVRSMPQPQGVTFASLSERFQRDPETVHSWMASGAGGIMCHFVVPRRNDVLVPFRAALERCAAILLGRADALAGASPPGSVTPPPAATAAPATAADAGQAGEPALKAAIAAVPAANRPVAIAMRNGMSFDGTFAMPKAEPWMLFANGWATDCTDWDPAAVAPTPAVLKAAPYKCSVDRWRGSAGSGYEFETPSGKWEKTAPTALLAFRPGQRIEVDLVNRSGFGTPAGAPGLSVGSLTSGQLTMSSTGRIALGSWTAVAVSGDQVGGGSSSRRGPSVGSYYLDGHLIAIADQRGGIRRGFIAEDRGRGGPYIYLNGELYWPKRR